jgi:hypothetical protein
MYEITSLGLINNLNNMKNYKRALWKLHYGLYIYIYVIHIVNRTIRNLTNIKKCVCIHIMEHIKYTNFTFTLLNGTN